MCIQNPIVKGQYQTADNPIFEVFYLGNPHGVIADFSGNPPYEFYGVFLNSPGSIFGIFSCISASENLDLPPVNLRFSSLNCKKICPKLHLSHFRNTP